MTTAHELRFREPAKRDTPQLYAWAARALYVGPALGLSPHRNAVAVLALGLDATFGVATDPHKMSAGYRLCRSALIPPNTLHHLGHTSANMAFLYMDPRSRDLKRLWGLAGEQTERAAFDLSIEDPLIGTLGSLGAGTIRWGNARPVIEDMLSGLPRQPLDQRVKRAMDRLHADPAARLSLADLACDVHLSESRFLHLFKDTTGVPLRRYKLWVAMGASMRAIARGDSLTTAALDAGFSSSAHFSASFREMFGLEPSRFAGGRLAAFPMHGDSV